ncbi:DUF2202 domain-containing protein [Aquifex sp.]
MKKRILGALLSVVLLGACGGGGGGIPVATNTTNPIDVLAQQVSSLPYQNIDTQEEESVLFVREEEKLARDAYLYLYDLYGLQIFFNIADSEQCHMDAVKLIIDKYGLSDPVEQTGDARGVFVNETLQQLYNDLTARGQTSLEEALLVGGFIEENDLIDLSRRMENTDNEDFKLVLDELRKGSARHLVAFSQEYKNTTGKTYTPQLLCQEDYDYIINNCQPGSDCVVQLQCEY